jgi:xanthine permease XanP
VTSQHFMSKRPPTLIYSVEDKPPLGTSILLGVQHVFVISVGWVFVIVIVTGMGGTPEQAEQVIQFSMLASGVATILQARSNSTLGSGYLCPISCGPAYISASILAGKTGGFPLIFGMTAISGLFEALLSRIMQRLRALFPPEVTGLVVSMVGLELIHLAVPRFFGFDTSDPRMDSRSIMVALLTLAAMIAPSVWSKGKLKLYPVLLGMLTGYLSAYAAGLLGETQLHRTMAAPLLSLPRRIEGGWLFNPALLLAFFIASLASTLKSVGDLTLCQRINDMDWKRTEMKSVSGGILAGSIGTMLAGVLGGAGQSTFSSNVGLSIATGATSRHIAMPCGLILIVLAFFPKLATLFSIMPAPVMGAIMIYVACFMIVAGIQVITSRMLDARRTFVVGIAMVFGLSVEMVPELYTDLPEVLSLLFGSALSLATLMVIVLNLLFRIGVKTHVELMLAPQDLASEKIFAFMEIQGGNWGARKEVINRATFAMNEFIEGVRALELAKGNIKVAASFDELNLDIDFRYRGTLMEFPVKRPSEADLLLDDKAVARLAGFLVRNYADRIQSNSTDEACRVQLHFDH